jgi:hypothetical protein
MPCDADWQPRPPWHYRAGGRPTIPDPDLRASEMERTEVANKLCRHFGDGRLDEAELNERLGLAMAAKTRRDLAPLLADLPSLGAVESAPTAKPPRRPIPLALIVLVAIVVAWSIHLAFWAPHVPWWLIGILVIMVWRHGGRRRADRRGLAR